jgi:hypothetical protein
MPQGAIYKKGNSGMRIVTKERSFMSIQLTARHIGYSPSLPHPVWLAVFLKRAQALPAPHISAARTVRAAIAIASVIAG